MTDIRKEYSRAAKLVVSLGAFFIFLLLAEILLSFAKIESTNDNPFFPINRDINFPEVYKLDSELFWKFRENSEISSAQYSKISYRINSLGLRGKEIVNKEKVQKILLIPGNIFSKSGIVIGRKSKFDKFSFPE